MGSVLLVNGNLHGGAIYAAARLQARTEPAGIWTTKPVIRQVQADTTFEALSELQLKNIAQRINAFRVIPGRDK